MPKYFTLLALISVLVAAMASKPVLGHESASLEISSKTSRLYGLLILKSRLQQVKGSISKSKTLMKKRVTLGSAQITPRFAQFARKAVRRLREAREMRGKRPVRMVAIRRVLRELLSDLEKVPDVGGRSMVRGTKKDMRELREIVTEIIKDGDKFGWDLEDIMDLVHRVLGADGCVSELIAFLSTMFK
ncbi:hypothetical protein FGB62_21g27 [Gracilaria domingensis]|nr:hypothetical protein FGB62_21g27 [Gracilaria domingensis]